MSPTKRHSPVDRPITSTRGAYRAIWRNARRDGWADRVRDGQR